MGQDICFDMQLQLPWLLNSTLSSEQTLMTLDHVRGCSVCLQELALLSTLEDAAHAVWRLPVAEEFTEVLWQRIVQAEPQVADVHRSPSAGIGAVMDAIKYAMSPLGLTWDMVAMSFRAVLDGVTNVIGESAAP